MTIPSSYFANPISFSKTCDITKAYMMDPKNTSGTLVNEVQNVYFATDPNNKAFFYFTYAETYLTQIRDLSTTDQFGAAALISSFSTLQNTAYSTIRSHFQALVSNSTNLYTLSDLTATKFDAFIAAAPSLITALTNLRTSAATLLNNINSVKAALPLNQPTTAMYNAVTTGYTNLANGIALLITALDIGINSTSTLNSNLSNMKGLVQGKNSGEIDETDYIAYIKDYCSSCCSLEYLTLRVLYNFAKCNPSSI